MPLKPKRLWAVLLIAAAGVGVLTRAGAHSPGHSQVHPVLDPLPPALDGLTVQVAETLAPQLLVENRTGKVLEVLDARGRAFVRIGPEGVEADTAAAAWYQTASTAGTPVPEAARDPAAAPHWVLQRRDPSWGWFDPRIGVSGVKVSHEIADSEDLEDVGRWTVPVRWDGQDAAIIGRFQFRPFPPGLYSASVTAFPALPPAILLQIMQGDTPGLFLANRSGQTITVLGLDGEPYIRLGPGGTDVNTDSTTWRQYGRERTAGAPTTGSTTGSTGTPQWLHVSPQPTYTWLEPRATVPADAAYGDSHPDRRWQVPIDIDGKRIMLDGVSTWTKTVNGPLAHADDD